MPFPVANVSAFRSPARLPRKRMSSSAMSQPRRSTSRPGAILNLMVRLQREFGLTYIFISHIRRRAALSDQLAIMFLGALVEVGPADELFTVPRHPYTRLLLECTPRRGGAQRDRAPMTGEVPSPIAAASGLPLPSPLHDRCPESQVRAPSLRTSGPVQVACDLWLRANSGGPLYGPRLLQCLAQRRQPVATVGEARAHPQ